MVSFIVFLGIVCVMSPFVLMFLIFKYFSDIDKVPYYDPCKVYVAGDLVKERRGLEWNDDDWEYWGQGLSIYKPWDVEKL